MNAGDAWGDGDDSAVARWGSRDGTDARGGGFIKTSFFKSIYPRRLIGAVAVARDARVRSMGSVSPASTRNGTGVRASSGWWHASCSVRSCDAVSRAMCRTGRHPSRWISVRFVSSSVQSRRRRANASRRGRSIDRSVRDRRTDAHVDAGGWMGVKRNPPAIDRSGFGRRVGSVWRFTIRECVCVPEAGKSEMWIDLHFR